jgi:predicted dehydrogenase
MLNIGFIGCGQFARFYHVPTLLASDRARIAAVLDPAPSAEILTLASERGIRLAGSLSELLEPGLIDAAIVSSPHALHFEHAMAAIAAGKPVLVDKPFVLESAQGKALAEAAERRRLVAGVAFNRRLDAGCRRAAALVAAGALGPVRYLETNQLGYPQSGWLADPALGGGGPFVGRGAHMADLVPWLTGVVPDSVSARIVKGEAGKVDRGGTIDLQFRDFTCRMTCIDRGLAMWDEVRLFGEDGYIELRRPWSEAIGWELVWREKTGAERERVKADTSPGACTTNFLAALLDGAPLACSFADALVSVRIIEAAFQSAADDGEPVALGL